MTKKKIGSVHTAKNGRRYKITSKGARFISGKAKKKGKKGKKGGGFWKNLGNDITGAAKYFTS